MTTTATVQPREGFQAFFAHPGNVLSALYGKERVMPVVQQAILSGNSSGTQFVIGDVASIEGSISGMVAQFIPYASGSLMDMGISLERHAYGTASGLNTFIGVLSLKEDFQRLAYSDGIGDSRGSLINRVGIAKDVVFAGSGVAFLPYRIMSIIGTTQGVSAGLNSVSLLGRVATGFSYAGMIFYSLFFTCLSIIFGMNIYEGQKLRNKLGKSDDLSDQVAVLFKKLEIDQEKMRAKLQAKYEKQGLSPDKAKVAADEELKEEALNTGSLTLKKLLKEMNVEGVSDKQLREAVEKLVETQYDPNDALAQKVTEDLALKGLQIRADKLALKKETKLERAVGASALAELKKAHAKGDLSARIRSGDPDAQKIGRSLLDKVFAGMNKNRLVFGISTAVCILGVVAMITSMVFTGGLSAVVAGVIMLVFALAMFGVDFYFLKESYATEKSAPMDKPLLAISSTLCLVSLASIIGLAVAGIIALGPFSIAILALLTILWLGQNALTWNKIDENTDRFNLESPTLETFLEALKAKESQERLSKMLQNLPKELREMIAVELESLDGGAARESYAKAVQKTIEKIEQLREKELEALRGVLTPMFVK